jgi:hypothetical protein
MGNRDQAQYKNGESGWKCPPIEQVILFPPDFFAARERQKLRNGSSENYILDSYVFHRCYQKAGVMVPATNDQEFLLKYFIISKK